MQILGNTRLVECRCSQIYLTVATAVPTLRADEAAEAEGSGNIRNRPFLFRGL